MLNINTIFAFTLLSSVTSIQANESTIDITHLHAAINAQLVEGIEGMQQDLTEDLNALLSNEDKVTLAEILVLRAE